MVQKKSKKILVLTSTFPRWADDNIPPFVFELSKRLAREANVCVLAPHYPGSKVSETFEKIKIVRFRYFFSRFEKLAGNGGVLPTLKKNKIYYLLVPFFILGQIIMAINIVKKEKPNIVHAHWIVPQGLTALIIFKLFNIPYVLTSHGGDIFGLRNKLICKLKKIILVNSKKITVVSHES